MNQQAHTRRCREGEDEQAESWAARRAYVANSDNNSKIYRRRRGAGGQLAPAAPPVPETSRVVASIC
jgi:hypothetical protein